MSSENAANNRAPQSSRNGRPVGEATEPKIDRTEFDRLVRMMRLRPGMERSSARIHLNPPELGRILVDVRVDGDALHLDIRTETDEAKAVLLTRVQQLRAALEQTGLQVEQFQISKDVAAVLGMKPEEQQADRRDARRAKENSRRMGRVTGGVRDATNPTDARGAASVDAAGSQTQHVRNGVTAERRLDVKI